jgi:hypothetical protein
LGCHLIEIDLGIQVAGGVLLADGLPLSPVGTMLRQKVRELYGSSQALRSSR